MCAFTNGNGAPVKIKGRGIPHRKLSDADQLKLAVGLLSGDVLLHHLSWKQMLAVMPGISVFKVYIAGRGRRNGRVTNTPDGNGAGS
jgi:hypothetical protein